jgi:5,6-dimethylbenzimidazole synthase
MVQGLVREMRETDAFSPAERRGVYRAIYERRDIRSQFVPDAVPDSVLGRLLDAAHHGPSVGFMQPWDFIVIRDEAVRRAIHDCFLQANRQAAERYQGERRELYDSLKLAGILDAPVNLCITCDRERARGNGLGRQTDPATDMYSTICAVQNLWLAARAESLGVGWVSILNFDRLRELLAIPAGVVPVAYLCVGYVSEFPARPELETAGWASREDLARLIHFESWAGRDEQRASRLLSGEDPS